MKRLLFFLSLLFISNAVGAQVIPQHYIDFHPNGPGGSSVLNYQFITDTGVIQNLCPADSFTNNPPYGRIKNVYVRTGVISSHCKSYKLNIMLGYTSLLNLDTCNYVIPNLTWVAKADSLVMGDTLGDWVRIALSEQVVFNFNPAKNLVVNMYMDSGVAMNYCLFLSSQSSITHFYSHTCTKNNPVSIDKNYHYFDFGFDLYPTGIEAISNIADLTIYPNPAVNTCKVSFTAKKQMAKATVVICDVTGKELQREVITSKGNNRFAGEIDVSSLPRGLYLMQLTAGEGRITRKIVVE